MPYYYMHPPHMHPDMHGDGKHSQPASPTKEGGKNNGDKKPSAKEDEEPEGKGEGYGDEGGEVEVEHV